MVRFAAERPGLHRILSIAKIFHLKQTCHCQLSCQHTQVLCYRQAGRYSAKISTSPEQEIDRGARAFSPDFRAFWLSTLRQLHPQSAGLAEALFAQGDFGAVRKASSRLTLRAGGTNPG